MAAGPDGPHLPLQDNRGDLNNDKEASSRYPRHPSTFLIVLLSSRLAVWGSGGNRRWRPAASTMSVFFSIFFRYLCTVLVLYLLLLCTATRPHRIRDVFGVPTNSGYRILEAVRVRALQYTQTFLHWNVENLPAISLFFGVGIDRLSGYKSPYEIETMLNSSFSRQRFYISM